VHLSAANKPPASVSAQSDAVPLLLDPQVRIRHESAARLSGRKNSAERAESDHVPLRNRSSATVRSQSDHTFTTQAAPELVRVPDKTNCAAPADIPASSARALCTDANGPDSSPGPYPK
jgi:hypothetical protein